MDINERDQHFEKGEKNFLKLKESFKKIFETSLLNEDAFAAQKKLKKNLKEEEKPEDVEKVEEPKAEEPKADEPVAAPEGDVAPAGDEVAPAADAAPAPVDVSAPEGDINSQDQLATREFVSKFMKGLPSDINFETSVDANGIFKAPVNDQHEGQFVVVVYPAAKNIHQVADLLEPALPAPGAAVDPALASVDPAAAGAAPAVPAVDPAAGAPVDAAAPAVDPAAAAPSDASALDVPAEGGEEEDEMKETVCEAEGCLDEACKTHGKKMEEECEDEEAKLEKQRDPMMEGRKNWKSYLKVLTEKKQAIKEEAPAAGGDEVSKLERRIKVIEDQLKSETDPEEKKALQADLGKAKLALGKAKEGKKDKSDVEKLYKGKAKLADDSKNDDDEK